MVLQTKFPQLFEDDINNNITFIGDLFQYLYELNKQLQVEQNTVSEMKGIYIFSFELIDPSFLALKYLFERKHSQYFGEQKIQNRTLYYRGFSQMCCYVQDYIAKRKTLP